MSSLLTNASAMTALQTLSQTNKNLATTQGRISTGQRVAEASDNAAYWSIATNMRSHNSSLSAVQDAIGSGRAVVDTAYTGLNEAIDLSKQIMAKYVAHAAMEAGSSEQTALEGEITQLKAQVKDIAAAATFQGKNLLTSTTAAEFVVGYKLGAADNTAAVTKLSVDGYDLSTALDSATDANAVEKVIDLMTAAAADFGAAKVRLDSQARFTSSLMDSIDRGIGQLVDADMNKESTRLSALQVQQQLGIQALSIANSNSQSILSLFR